MKLKYGLVPAEKQDAQEYCDWAHTYYLEYAPTDTRPDRTIAAPDIAHIAKCFETLGLTVQVFWIQHNQKKIGYFTLKNININSTDVWVIEDVYITPKYRGKGLAKRFRSILIQEGVFGSYIDPMRLLALIPYYTQQGYRSMIFDYNHMLAIVCVQEPDGQTFVDMNDWSNHVKKIKEATE